MIFTWIAPQFFLVLCLLHIIEVSSVGQIVAKPISLVYFFAPDCQFCLAFHEDFEYISYIYNSDPKFQVVRVNGRENIDLKNLFDVNYFPTIKLYDDLNKRVTTFTDDRLVLNLHKFIKKHTGIDPDTSKIDNQIVTVSSMRDIEENVGHKKPILIAFVDKQDKLWANYHYPGHFYQLLARRFPDIKFTLKFMEDGGLELMETYRVSNTPSLVMVEGDHIGIYNTLSTNSITNSKLDAKGVETFLNDFKSKKEGTWFGNSENLYLFEETCQFVGHKQRKPGMNYVEGKLTSNFDGLELEEQYQVLLEEIIL